MESATRPTPLDTGTEALISFATVDEDWDLSEGLMLGLRMTQDEVWGFWERVCSTGNVEVVDGEV